MWTQGFIYIHKLKINLLRKDCRAEKRGTRVRHSRHKHGGDTHKQEWLDHLWQPWRSWIMYTLAVGNMTLTIPRWVTLIWERQTKTYERKTPTIRAGEMEPVWQKSTDSPTAHTSESFGPQRTVSVSTFSPLSALLLWESLWKDGAIQAASEKSPCERAWTLRHPIHPHKWLSSTSLALYLCPKPHSSSLPPGQQMQFI